ncbi:hypothetical protein PAECIP111893_02760 [Paenibacillus plantiphilus]|uniref:Copper amine oxidase-like N-terminal domain-containing protein n=1 Tax=Paenibacillus plantiphilus TaxID=2905650 RepID=A0ABN8GKF2_9BACL|nr:copper amine oxidase N-terminal domain-containing protein [Paenibacillus plantiphilus]CAH1207704.1 hypothetical protein PAECIP111893_02760 [Paenibacillus plantiphilus]
MLLLRKRLLAGLAALLIALSSGSIPAAADVPIGVIVNGLKVAFADAQPYVDINNRTMVPLRIIVQKLGATLQWQSNGRIEIKYGQRSVALRLNSLQAVVNGKRITLDTSAVQVEGRTMVPLRFISEGLGAKVRWDSEAYTVLITDEVFAKSSPNLDAWGRLIRTERLPGNTGEWAYVLEDVSNSAYIMGYRKQINPASPRMPASEAFQNPNFNRENLDQWVKRIRNYYDLVFSVDYRTIDPSTWAESFRPYMNSSSLDSITRVQYAEWVQNNGIRLEGWAEPEPSMTYMQDGKYMMRTMVRFRVLEADADYGTLLDTFQASYEVKLKIGVWYRGYADIVLSTNVSGDPWPHYGVELHDHLFFTPVGSIQEEVGEQL